MEIENWIDDAIVPPVVRMNVVYGGSMKIENRIDDFFIPPVVRMNVVVQWFNGDWELDWWFLCFTFCVCTACQYFIFICCIIIICCCFICCYFICCCFICCLCVNFISSSFCKFTHRRKNASLAMRQKLSLLVTWERLHLQHNTTSLQELSQAIRSLT